MIDETLYTTSVFLSKLDGTIYTTLVVLSMIDGTTADFI